jgi:xylan 1,4-beta-xylosidase
MGPWLAETIAAADGKVTTMSYWTFSDVFGEQGIFKTPFYGGFGLVAPLGIPKASFHAFRLLHLLGDQRLDAPSDSLIVTRRKDGSLVIALWNYAEPGSTGQDRNVTIQLRNTGSAYALLHRVDAGHHSTLEEWIRMGRPASLTAAQISKLRAVGAALKPERIPLKNGRMDVRIPAPGLALIQIGGH